MAEPTQAEQAEIMKALQAGAFRSKAPASSSLHSSFDDPVNDLTNGEGSKTNSRKVYCFREGCGSVILSPGAATYVESTETIVCPLCTTQYMIRRGLTDDYVQIPNDPASPFPLVAPTPPYGYWHVPDPYAFDNVGFSRPDTNSKLVIPASLPGNDGQNQKIKWLICAECDLGPIGWGYEGGKEAWVALDRVRYGAK